MHQKVAAEGQLALKHFQRSKGVTNTKPTHQPSLSKRYQYTNITLTKIVSEIKDTILEKATILFLT